MQTIAKSRLATNLDFRAGRRVKEKGRRNVDRGTDRKHLVVDRRFVGLENYTEKTDNLEIEIYRMRRAIYCGYIAAIVLVAFPARAQPQCDGVKIKKSLNGIKGISVQQNNPQVLIAGEVEKASDLKAIENLRAKCGDLIRITADLSSSAKQDLAKYISARLDTALVHVDIDSRKITLRGKAVSEEARTKCEVTAKIYDPYGYCDPTDTHKVCIRKEGAKIVNEISIATDFSENEIRQEYFKGNYHYRTCLDMAKIALKSSPKNVELVKLKEFCRQGCQLAWGPGCGEGWDRD